MDKKQNLTSFQELTTTELNQITGGGWWEDLLYRFNVIQKDFISQYNYKKRLGKSLYTLRKSNSNHVSVALPYSSTAYG